MEVVGDGELSGREIGALHESVYEVAPNEGEAVRLVRGDDPSSEHSG